MNLEDFTPEQLRDYREAVEVGSEFSEECADILAAIGDPDEIGHETAKKIGAAAVHIFALGYMAGKEMNREEEE